MDEKVKVKTWHIKDDGNIICIPGKIKELKEMQKLVKGYIEVECTDAHNFCCIAWFFETEGDDR